MSTDAPLIVLAATDLSEASRSAVTFAARLARVLGGTLELVHVADMASHEPIWAGTDEGVLPYVEQLRQKMIQRLDESTDLLERERARCEAMGTDTVAKLLQGHVWESVLNYAKRIEPSFLVAGPHGPEPQDSLGGAVRERVLGSTADRLVRYSTCPVWVVPPQTEKEEASQVHESPFLRLLVAADFSGSSSAAVQLATNLAERVEGSVHVFHALPKGYFAYDETNKFQKAYRQARLKRAELQLLELAKGIASVEVTRRVQHGTRRAHEDILAEAKELSSTAIVMGTHGRTGLTHLLLGSTAERCLRDALIPVLVVRAPDDAAKEESQ